MTGQVTFGDLLDTARAYLDQACRVHGRPESATDLPDVARGMHALTSVIGQYLLDAATKYDRVPARKGVAAPPRPPSASPWRNACLQARRAAVSAIRYLEPLAGIRQPGTAASECGQHLAAAALALVAGRDLLNTHTATLPNGLQEGRSGWAPVIATPIFHRTIAGEMASLARQAAALGASFVPPPIADRSHTTPEHQAIHDACQSLRILHGTIQAAHLREPVTNANRDLIRAVPVSIAPPRRLPDGTEPIGTLCDGVVNAAERLRHSASVAAVRTAGSPSLNAESLRYAAAASVAASHNCAVLLRTLASSPAAPRSGDDQARFAEAAKAAGQARDSWLRVARALDLVTSDMRAHVSADASDARELALWTGRLAYADPAWTPASGPRQTAREPAKLAATPGEASLVLAAVHHASDSLQHLVAAHHQQAWLAARAGRFLVPTRSLSDDYDIPRPYAAAPPDRAGAVLSAYEAAHSASIEATTAVATVATAAEAASRTLVLAEAIREERQHGISDKHVATPPSIAVIYQAPRIPGPVERSLQSLGITDSENLRRAAAIDSAGEQLITDACVLRRSRQALRVSGLSTSPTASYDANATDRRSMSAAVPTRSVPSAQLDDPEREV